MNAEPANPQRPEVLSSIALSLSGGGYRAATFHLGTLSMLNRIGLLGSVRALSTVSGGTIVGAAWARSLVAGRPFGEFEAEFKQFLTSTNVIQESLSRLDSSSNINGFAAMPSLIRAAAETYASSAAIGRDTFGTLAVVPSPADGATQLQDITFNATDFRSGNSFRFQQGNSAAVYSGNRLARIASEASRRIRIADIVASSSCFPGGFEPIRFPSDFNWGGANELAEIKDVLGEKFAGDLPLMDGGVYDNQGIDSISLIFERTGKDIDVYIVSDTSQRNPAHLTSSLVGNRWGLRLKTVSLLSWLLMIASFITVIAISVDAYLRYYSDGISIWRGMFLYLVPLLLAAGTAYGLFKLRRLVRKFLVEFDDETGINVWESFKHVRLPAAVELTMTRFKSVAAMATSVFMKRIRDLGYKRIYGDSDFTDKRISNMIYDLDNESEWRDYVEKAGITPSARLRQVAVNAEAYGTNLWFTRREDLDNLFACGEATMCFNVLRYLLECRAESLKNPASPESELYARAKKLWDSVQ